MSREGFIKDYRQELDSDIWIMPPLYHRVWQYLKYEVNHKESEIPMKDGTKFLVKKGQRLTSYRNISKSIGWYEGLQWKEPNPKTIKTICDWLEKNNMIIQEHGKGNRQYTLITIVNWDLYQAKNDNGVTLKKQIRNTKETDKKQVVDINKNDKNVKNDKNDNNIYSSDSNEYRLAVYLFNFIKRNNEKAKDPNFQTWAKHFDYILRIDKRELEEVKSVIKYCQDNSFWFKNILSPDKLRKQYDRLFLEMKSPQKSNYAKNESTFNAFKQRDYNKEYGGYSELEKKLLGWDNITEQND